MSTAVPLHSLEQLWEQLWISMASVLRSYTALHGLGGSGQAEIEHDKERIVARHKDKWLTLERKGAQVSWTRENGSCGTLQLTEAGRLKNGQGEDEMDLAAEAWARELMR